MELIGYAVMGVGSLIAFVGWIWLVVLGFKEGGPLWGILIFFFTIIGGLIFCIVKKTGWLPWALMLVGALISTVGIVPVALKVMSEMDGIAV